jgi:prevent-host-death family protein
MDTWKMQEAETRLSELIERADTSGPQQITLNGRAVAVVLSRREHDRLTGARESLVDFMRRSPLYGLDDLEFPREQGLARDNPL